MLEYVTFILFNPFVSRKKSRFFFATGSFLFGPIMIEDINFFGLNGIAI